MKRKILNILYTAGIVFIFLVIALVVFIFLDFKGMIYYTRYQSVSPDTEYKITIMGNGPKWPFGTEDIKVVANKNNITDIFNKSVVFTEIANDGKPLDDSCFSVIWNGNKAAVILRGEEQQDEIFEIVFGDTVTITESKISSVFVASGSVSFFRQ